MRGVVAAPVCPLLTKPRPDSPLADEALYGMAVETLARVGDYWRVRTPYRYEGYAPASCLRVGDALARGWAEKPQKMLLHKNAMDVLTCPRFQSPTHITLPLGSTVAVEGEGEEGWQRVTLADGGSGYVRASWLGDCPRPPVDLPEAVLRKRLVETALRYRYAPYRWGGKTPWGIDCSGLAFMAYWLNGMVIWRDAAIRPGFDLVEIPKEQIAPGDLLFFPGHVAMYLGEGEYLHATGHPGSDGVTVNSLDPAAPGYRPDLADSITHAGSYAGFHR